MNKQEIIIVDDNDLLTFLHSEIVSMAGYGENTPSFAHGKLAYDYLVERKGNEIPLLILLDINMPIMNGWDVLDVLPNIERQHCREAKGKARQTPE